MRLKVLSAVATEAVVGNSKYTYQPLHRRLVLST